MSEESFVPRLDAMATRWSLIQRAHGDMKPAAVDARRVLVLRYAPAIKSYIRGITKDESLADELSQDVVVRLLQGDFAGADPRRGRFRNFLKTAIRNMVRNHWARDKSRSTVDLDVESVGSDPRATQSAPDPWEERWKNRVLELTWAALSEHERENPQSMAHAVLRLRGNFPDESAEQLAERLSAQTAQPLRADALRQKLRRARVLFAECLVQELADGLDDPTLERVQDELMHLNLYDQVRSLLPEDWRIDQSA